MLPSGNLNYSNSENENNTDHHQCFLILFFVSVYKNLLFLYGYENLMNLCIGIDSGRFFEEDFLLSVSRVLLRIILFREDIRSIAVFSYSSESFALVEYISLYFIIMYAPHFRILFMIVTSYKIRAFIEPLLYKKCVSE